MLVLLTGAFGNLGMATAEAPHPRGARRPRAGPGHQAGALAGGPAQEAGVARRQEPGRALRRHPRRVVHSARGARVRRGHPPRGHLAAQDRAVARAGAGHQRGWHRVRGTRHRRDAHPGPPGVSLERQRPRPAPARAPAGDRPDAHAGHRRVHARQDRLRRAHPRLAHPVGDHARGGLTGPGRQQRHAGHAAHAVPPVAQEPHRVRAPRRRGARAGHRGVGAGGAGQDAHAGRRQGLPHHALRPSSRRCSTRWASATCPSTRSGTRATTPTGWTPTRRSASCTSRAGASRTTKKS
jgi:hypothetical protein